jgi:hypothetical protein
MDDTTVTIFIERAVDLIDDRSTYDPLSPYAQAQFYAHVIYLRGDYPNECEVRLSSKGEEEMVRITPRQLDEDGDLYFPLEALETAIDNVRKRTEANDRAKSERAGTIEGKGEEVST